MIKEKRGLSPVIATVLLVAVVLILAVIIFLWARAYFPEANTKDGRAIELVCEDVVFKAEAVKIGENIEVSVENIGTVALHGIEILKKSIAGGSVVKSAQFKDISVTAGETDSVSFNFEEYGLNTGDELIIVPILLGETDTQRKAYKCDKDYGVEITVK